MHSSERCLAQTDTNSHFSFYVFTPSLCCLLPKRIRNCFTLSDRAKLLLRAVRGYFLYYATDSDRLVGYCFLKRNYIAKYSFLGKNDVLINPYYVSEEYRGRGIGGSLISASICDTKALWDNVYAVVKSDNFPSVRTLEKLGFHRAGYSDKRGWSHRLTVSKTDLPVFILDRKEQEKQNDLQNQNSASELVR